MKIQPRQQLLEVWRATARSSFADEKWVWGAGGERNSIRDAEQLLCLMMPATEVESFRIDRPDETAQDLLDALSSIGDSIEVPLRLLEVLTEYMQTYTDSAGTPIFSGGSYFQPLEVGAAATDAQRALDVVDSFSMSVRLCLATVAFVKGFRTVVHRDEIRHQIDELEEMASTRLTAAMIGLLRSFTINVFDPNSPEGVILCRTVNQADVSTRKIIDDLHRRLRAIHAGLRDLTLGTGQATDLDNPNRLFECGWSWGIARDNPPVKTTSDIGKQPDGVAQPAPYLYFTVVALDGIQDLFSERTRILGLLNEEQWRLARSLQLRWDLTQLYWSRIARFGQGRWPLEDIPWRTTDGEENDYFSLLVASILVQELLNRQASDAELVRVGNVLDELASRARITRRESPGDIAVRLHAPGVRIELVGSELVEGDPSETGPRLSWLVSDFSPQLLKRTIRVGGRLRETDARSEMLTLSDTIWEHVAKRRYIAGSALNLWDHPGRVYASLKPAEAEETRDTEPSWYYTERVVECLVTAANVVDSDPLRSPTLRELTADMLIEADHLFDQELLTVSAEAGPTMGGAMQTIRATLRRAHDKWQDRPGTAFVLVSDVLRELNRLAAAREDATSSGAL